MFVGNSNGKKSNDEERDHSEINENNASITKKQKKSTWAFIIKLQKQPAKLITHTTLAHDKNTCTLWSPFYMCHMNTHTHTHTHARTVTHTHTHTHTHTPAVSNLILPKHQKGLWTQNAKKANHISRYQKIPDHSVSVSIRRRAQQQKAAHWLQCWRFHRH